MSFALRVDLAALDAQLDADAAAAERAARPAAQAGAEVLYQAVRRQAPRSQRQHYFYGTSAKKLPRGKKRAAAYGPFEPGTLQKAVYQAYSQDHSGQGRAVYHVSWNEKKAPWGHMVEYGTRRAPAHPFVRPAQLLFPQAQQAMIDRYWQELADAGVVRA